jgi:hypothetical protein
MSILTNCKDVFVAKRSAEFRQQPRGAAGVWTRGLVAVVLINVLGTIVLILGLTVAALIWVVIVLAVLGTVIRITFRLDVDRRSRR